MARCGTEGSCGTVTCHSWTIQARNQPHGTSDGRGAVGQGSLLRVIVSCRLSHFNFTVDDRRQSQQSALRRQRLQVSASAPPLPSDPQEGGGYEPFFESSSIRRSDGSVDNVDVTGQISRARADVKQGSANLNGSQSQINLEGAARCGAENSSGTVTCSQRAASCQFLDPNVTADDQGCGKFNEGPA